jgi:hypothetical protein
MNGKTTTKSTTIQVGIWTTLDFDVIPRIAHRKLRAKNRLFCRSHPRRVRNFDKLAHTRR